MQKQEKLEQGKDKKLKNDIKKNQSFQRHANKAQKINQFFTHQSSGFLEAEENEQTLKFRQKDLKPLLPQQNSQNIINLDLDHGQYMINYSRNGKNLLMAGSHGHLSLLEWQNKKLVVEFDVKEKIYDTAFIQGDNLFAVAQQRYCYIYDQQGIEVHRLKSHLEPIQLQYLPYHYLLISASRLGMLKYHDVSTGQIVAEYQSKIKQITTMTQNQTNGIMCVGDSRGKIQMFSPNTSQPLVQIQTHKASVQSIAIHPNGNYLSSIGKDGFLKIWDLRTYKQIYDYWTPPQSNNLEISQTGLLGYSVKDQVIIWKDWYLEKQKLPYMKQESYKNKMINNIKFVPYEDYLGMGLHNGFQNIVVPGAGEANFDTFEVNLFQTKKQKQEAEVKALLEKIPYDTITLDQNIIGTIDTASKEVIQREQRIAQEEIEQKKLKNKKQKVKQRGKNKSGKREQKKESVYDEVTRKKLSQQANNRILLKRAEKEKSNKEISLLNQLDELLDFDPIKSLKKVKKQ